MKTTSLKTIYLAADELKQAIVEYLAKEHEDLAQHLYDNECEMAWGQDGKEFLVSIDGEVEDKEGKSLPWYGKCAHCYGGYPDQECTCKEKAGETVMQLDKVGTVKLKIKSVKPIEYQAIEEKREDEGAAICDCCGERKENFTVISDAQLSGAVMCEDCRSKK